MRELLALFMAMKNNDGSELGDPTFIPFLTNLIDHMHILNLSLQEPKQVITALCNCVKSFECKLSFWLKQLGNGNLAHFKILAAICGQE